MGIYVSIRGWLECDETQLTTAQEIISSHADNHYSNGWSTPQQQVNWTSYIFYGADIRESALDWFMNQLREIARIPASDNGGELIRGLFLAGHEVDGLAQWQVRDGELVILPADTRHQYLDE